MRITSDSTKLYLIIIAAVTVLLFAQSLTFDFVNYDDYDLIYENTSFLSNPTNIFRAFTSHAFVGNAKQAYTTALYFR